MKRKNTWVKCFAKSTASVSVFSMLLKVSLVILYFLSVTLWRLGKMV